MLSGTIDKRLEWSPNSVRVVLLCVMCSFRPALPELSCSWAERGRKNAFSESL